MNNLQEFALTEALQDTLSNFLNQYGTSGLEQALRLYIDTQRDYICKTKTSISKFKINDIYYLEIQEHRITIHTQHGTYHKYGTLNKELMLLAPHGFIKCSQNCVVALNKIRTISGDNIILINNTKLHMSRIYAPKVLIAFKHKK